MWTRWITTTRLCWFSSLLTTNFGWYAPLLFSSIEQMTLCQKQRTNFFSPCVLEGLSLRPRLKIKARFCISWWADPSEPIRRRGRWYWDKGLYTPDQGQSQGEGRASRSAIAAGPRMRTALSSPLVGDRWVAENCFTKHKVCIYLFKSTTATLTLHLFFLKSGLMNTPLRSLRLLFKQDQGHYHY